MSTLSSIQQRGTNRYSALQSLAAEQVSPPPRLRPVDPTPQRGDVNKAIADLTMCHCLHWLY